VVLVPITRLWTQNETKESSFLIFGVSKRKTATVKRAVHVPGGTDLGRSLLSIRKMEEEIVYVKPCKVENERSCPDLSGNHTDI
jgi:hypothetical protein